MATVPPQIDYSSFGGYSSSDPNYTWPEHLLVPVGCKTIYENENCWKYFTIIEETEF